MRTMQRLVQSQVACEVPKFMPTQISAVIKIRRRFHEKATYEAAFGHYASEPLELGCCKNSF